MRVPLSWLRELVPLDLPLSEVSEALDMSGTAVDGVEGAGPSLDKVVVGEVLTREKHPSADKLSLSEVEVGRENPLRIVCGADNYGPGDKVPVALVGATLPNGMKIKKSKIRGEVSRGMMCSPIELGAGDDASGLMILPEDAPVGTPFSEYMGGGDDVVLDLEIMPNRPDCLSVAGMAREIGAVLDVAAAWPEADVPETGEPAGDAVAVEIADGALCPRYTARVIRDVKVGPSPDWLARRVTAAGARPINNIVDVTNYVMYELGQPLHAFDMDTLGVSDGKTTIYVRPASDGERFTTLDDQERTLSGDMIVIADPRGTVALAGVMGGENTEVSEDTVNVLLESASFDPPHISRTSRALGLVSEASLRFERRVDPEGCAAACDRAAALMAEVAGGKVARGVVDAYPVPAAPRTVTLRPARVNGFLGTSLGTDEMVAILVRLGLGVTPDGDELAVTVPAWRPDLEREVDLIEEVVRIHGMEKVASTLPGGRERVGGLTTAQRWRERAGAALRGAGLNETTTYGFIDPADMDRLGWELEGGHVPPRLLNPMSEEQSVLRWTLAPGLLRSVSNNQRRGVPDVHLYEIGVVFETEDGRKQPWEREVVGGALAGSWARPGWNDPAPALGFFDGKGAIESLAEELHLPDWDARPARMPWLQPGRSAEVLVAGEPAGWLGEVHPRVLEAYEAEGPVVLFELDMEPLVAGAVDVVTYEEVPRHPSVNLDVALVLSEDVPAGEVAGALAAAGGELLESVRVFDLYTGEGIPAGKKSLAFSLAYRAPDRTLTDEEVREVHDRLVSEVCEGLGAEIRG